MEISFKHNLKMSRLLAMMTIMLLLGACSGVDFQAKSDGSENTRGIPDCPAGAKDCDSPPDDEQPPNDEEPPEDEQPPEDDNNYSVKTVQVPEQATGVDILFVIDNSKSMRVELQNLGSNFKRLSQVLSGKDWQACYVTTDFDKDEGKLQNWKNGNKVIGKNTANFEKVFEDTLNEIEFGSNEEQGIRSAYAVFNKLGTANQSSCLRNGTAKAVIFVSDEDEGGNGWWPGLQQYFSPVYENKPENFLKLIAAKLGSLQMFSAHGIVIDPKDQICLEKQRDQAADPQDRERYGYLAHRLSQVISETGGHLVSICEQDYSQSLERIGARLVDSMAEYLLPCADGAEVKKVLAGKTTLAERAFSVQSNKVLFTPALAPGEIAEIYYRCK